jgi:hypothetical protein
MKSTKKISNISIVICIILCSLSIFIYSTKNTTAATSIPPPGIDEYLNKFNGTWNAYYTVWSEINDKFYGHQKISSNEPDLIFDISNQNGKIKIRRCKPNEKEGVFYFGKYENKIISLDGYAAERFYKMQVPTFKVLENGELLYSDGEGDFILKHSKSPIDSINRTYILFKPSN